MKSNDSNRELEDRLSLLQPQAVSPEFERKLKELRNEHSEQADKLAIAGSSNWSLISIGLTTAAVVVIIVSFLPLLWPQPREVEQSVSTWETLISQVPDPEVATIANFNLAIRRGDDIDVLLNHQCRSFLPAHPLTDVSLDGSNWLFQ